MPRPSKAIKEKYNWMQLSPSSDDDSDAAEQMGPPSNAKVKMPDWMLSPSSSNDDSVADDAKKLKKKSSRMPCNPKNSSSDSSSGSETALSMNPSDKKV